jgi:Fe-S-cluster containining protein
MVPKEKVIKLVSNDKKEKKQPSMKDCTECGNKCCQYIMIDWDEPLDEEDFDDLRWFITHRGATIHVDEGDWCVEFKMPCEKLGDDGKCTIYEKRPQMCRQYADDMIENGLCGGFQNIYETFDHYFSTIEELDAFIPGYLDELEDYTAIDHMKDFFSTIWAKVKTTSDKPIKNQ